MSMFFSKRAKLTFDSVSHGHWSMAWLHPCSACQPGIPRNKHPFIDIYLYIYICMVLYIVSSCFIHLSFIHDISKIFDIFDIQNIRRQQQQQPPLELYHLFLVYKNHMFPLWWLASNIPKFSMDQALAAWKFRHVVCSKCACGTVAWAARREIVLGEVVPSTSLIYVYIFIEREIDR